MPHQTYLTWKKKTIMYKTKDKPKLNLVTRSSRFVRLMFDTNQNYLAGGKITVNYD